MAERIVPGAHSMWELIKFIIIENKRLNIRLFLTINFNKNFMKIKVF